MNVIGIIAAVALPSFMLGVSAASWFIRDTPLECEACGGCCADTIVLCADCIASSPSGGACVSDTGSIRLVRA